MTPVTYIQRDLCIFYCKILIFKSSFGHTWKLKERDRVPPHPFSIASQIIYIPSSVMTVRTTPGDTMRMCVFFFYLFLKKKCILYYVQRFLNFPIAIFLNGLFYFLLFSVLCFKHKTILLMIGWFKIPHGIPALQFFKWPIRRLFSFFWLSYSFLIISRISFHATNTESQQDFLVI